MRVQDIMTKEPTCCLPEDGIRTVAQIMDDCDCGCVPIVQDHSSRKPIGVITDRDIVIRIIAAGEDYRSSKVEKAMTRFVVTVPGDTEIHEAEQIMKEKQLRRLIVVDSEGRCDGILSQADVARHTSITETGDVVEEISEPSRIAVE